MRELVRIDVGFDEGRCLFPNGIVAAHENDAAPHQRRYRIILAAYFDNVRHDRLLAKVAQRIDDADVMHKGPAGSS
jgi:hypothetical protein